MAIRSIISATAVLSKIDRQLRPLAGQHVLDAVNVQQDKREQILAAAAKSPALEAFTGRHQEMRDQILSAAGRSPALTGFAGQNRDMRNQILKAAGGSPALETLAGQSHKWREKVLQVVDASAILDSWSAQQQERYRQLLAAVGKSPALEQAFRNWTITLPSGVTDQMVAFQARLLASMASAAPAEVRDEEQGEVWFGAESWSRLHFEMVTILKCAD